MTAEAQLSDALYQILREVDSIDLDGAVLDRIADLARDALGLPPAEGVAPLLERSIT